MKLFTLIYFLFNITTIYCHSNLLSPQPRGNRRWWGFCSRGLGCLGACEAPKANAPILSIYHSPKTVRRGDRITIKWMRLNHPGGFIRLAMTPFEQSDDPLAFDNSAVKYTCFESNCRESKQDSMLGKDNGPGSTECSTEFTIPDYLPDGKVTLQWTWFGGGVYYADNKAGFGNYVSCSDMIINGGIPIVQRKSKQLPTFQGLDMGSNLNGMCRYWSSNDPYGCVLGAENKTDTKVGCGYKGMQFGKPNEVVTGRVSYFPLKDVKGEDPNSDPIQSKYSISGEGPKASDMADKYKSSNYQYSPSSSYNNINTYNTANYYSTPTSARYGTPVNSPWPNSRVSSYTSSTYQYTAYNNYNTAYQSSSTYSSDYYKAEPTPSPSSASWTDTWSNNDDKDIKGSTARLEPVETTNDISSSYSAKETNASNNISGTFSAEIKPSSSEQYAYKPTDSYAPSWDQSEGSLPTTKAREISDKVTNE